MSFELPVPPDFRFLATFQDTTRQPFGLTETIIDDKYFTLIAGQLIEIGLDSRRSVLVVQAPHAFDREQLGRELQRRFGLNQDLDQFQRRFANDSLIGPPVRKLIGLRAFQKSGHFEALVTAIADQQVNLAFAAQLKTTLIRQFGEKYQEGKLTLYAFPTPRRLARLDDLELKKYKFTGNKSRFIIRLARSIVNGELTLAEFEKYDDNQLTTALQSIYGVGRWTAEYVALISYGRMNSYPAADIGLQSILHKMGGLSIRPGEKECRRIGEKWEPFRGLVTFYLWYAYEQKII